MMISEYGTVSWFCFFFTTLAIDSIMILDMSDKSKASNVYMSRVTL